MCHQGAVDGIWPNGRLLKAVRASRLNWLEQVRSHAAAALAGDGVKQSHQFVSKLNYLSYINIKLTRYTAQHPVAQQDKPAGASYHRAA